MAIARVIRARCVPHQLDQFMAGLAEAKKIIEGHGARVTFYSNSAGGTSAAQVWPQNCLTTMPRRGQGSSP